MTPVTNATSRAEASVSGSSALRSASVSTGMMVREGLCSDRTVMKIARSNALLSRMTVSNMTFVPSVLALLPRHCAAVAVKKLLTIYRYEGSSTCNGRGFRLVKHHEHLVVELLGGCTDPEPDPRRS